MSESANDVVRDYVQKCEKNVKSMDRRRCVALSVSLFALWLVALYTALGESGFSLVVALLRATVATFVISAAMSATIFLLGLAASLARYWLSSRS